MSNLLYHFVAFIVVAIWGSTFVFTKLLLNGGLSPAQIFTLRFIIAYVLLLATSLSYYPRKMGWTKTGLKKFRLFADSVKDEMLMLGLGISGGYNNHKHLAYSLSLSALCNCAYIAVL